ncbi:hypothetical protein HRG_013104 [Hirsutella rhossiliensis]
MKILDYVSPRALKEWESNMEAELDGDRKKLAHEKHAGGENSDDDGEHAWVVKRLENMAVYDVEGRGLVRYLQMRWEGNWPPDRNPTWSRKRTFRQRCLANKVTDDTLGSNHGEDGADDDVRDAGVTSAFGQEGDDEGELFIIEEEQVRPAQTLQ